MAQAGNDRLHRLMEERGRIKAEVTRFKTFYDTRGAIKPIASLQVRLDRNFRLIRRFEAIHLRIIDIVALRKRSMNSIGMSLRIPFTG